MDVDLDWPEARIAARYLLPDTRTSGRESQPDSHCWYYADPLPTTKPYKLPGKGDDRSVVELRSTGGQTVVAPSRHPDGDCYVWGAGDVASVDGAALMEGVADVAAAALIARNWPGQGARHDYALAATGYIGRHVSRERAERIMEAAIAASGDDEARKRWRDVTDTLDGLDAGRPTTGGPTLDTLAPGVVDQLRRWHRWGTERSTGHTHQPSMTATPFNTTDLGNAERLVAQHGEDLRYCYPWAKWLVWDGKRWAVDAAGELERRAVETVRAIYAEAEAAPDSDERRRIAKHAMASESRARIEAMMALARSQPSVPVAPDDLDADPWILNVQNGTIDLRTGALRPHRHEDLITKVVPVEYDPDAHAPRFAQFLREIFDGDEDLISFVRRFAGYSLTGSTAERAFAILHGSGKNGKTTLVELLRDVLGNYAINTDTETILRKKYTGVGNDVAALKGARFVSAAEVEQGRALAEAKVKNLTGTDTVTARFLFAEPFDFRPEFKLWLSTNNKPIIRGTDDAIWDRIRLIPFTRRFKGRDADTRLPEKLRAEMPGVLRWGWSRVVLSGSVPAWACRIRSSPRPRDTGPRWIPSLRSSRSAASCVPTCGVSSRTSTPHMLSGARTPTRMPSGSAGSPTGSPNAASRLATARRTSPSGRASPCATTATPNPQRLTIPSRNQPPTCPITRLIAGRTLTRLTNAWSSLTRVMLIPMRITQVGLTRLTTNLQPSRLIPHVWECVGKTLTSLTSLTRRVAATANNRLTRLTGLIRLTRVSRRVTTRTETRSPISWRIPPTGSPRCLTNAGRIRTATSTRRATTSPRSSTDRRRGGGR